MLVNHLFFYIHKEFNQTIYLLDSSVFADKNIVAVVVDLKTCHEEKTQWWQEIRDYDVEKHPVENEEWNKPGKKYG